MASGTAGGAVHAGGQFLEGGVGLALQVGIGVQHAIAEHQPEAPRPAQREAHITQTLATQGRQRIGAATAVSRPSVSPTG